MRAVLYRRGGLGDTVLTFPVIEILKREGFHITAVGNTDYFALARHVGWADVVKDSIPCEDFDFEFIISYEGSVSPFPEGRKWIVQHYIDALRPSGNPEFSDILPVTPLPDSPFNGKVVIHPGSGSPSKIPSWDLFESIADYLETKGFQCVFFVGEADGHVKSKTSCFVESFEPLWIARSFKSAMLYLGLDSGISHVASYVGVPSVIIYGPSDPVVWKPIGRRVKQVYLNLDCSPCFPNVCSNMVCFNHGLLAEHIFPAIDHFLAGIY